MTALRHLRRLGQIAGFSLLCAFVLGGGYLLSLRFSGNFNPVVMGELYRSGQITPQQLDDYTAKYGVKTVVNLRGDSQGSSWYEAEIAESRRLHIDHIDFRLSARQELSSERAEELLALLRTARKPILIHCEAGADRSGLVSALYLAIVKHRSPAVAERQLSIRFGHFSLPFIAEYAMDRSFTKLEHALSVGGAEQAPSDQSDRCSCCNTEAKHPQTRRDCAQT